MATDPRWSHTAPVRIDAQSLQLFVLTVEHSSLSRAAETMGMSQPAASRRIGSLERDLGVRLLQRTANGSFPTDEGRRLLDASRTALSALRDVEIRALDASLGQRSIRVLASPVVGDYLLPRWLQTFTPKAPRVNVTVRNSPEVLEYLTEGKADLGLLCVPDIEPALRRSDLRARALVSDHLCIAVHPKHPWTVRREPVTIAELANAELVERDPGSETRTFLDRALAPHRAGRSPRPVVELSSSTALKNAVLDGAGPAILGTLTIQNELDEGRLATVDIEGFRYERILYAVWRAESDDDAQLMELVDAAARVAAKAGGTAATSSAT